MTFSSNSVGVGIAMVGVIRAWPRVLSAAMSSSVCGFICMFKSCVWQSRVSQTSRKPQNAPQPVALNMLKMATLGCCTLNGPALMLKSVEIVPSYRVQIRAGIDVGSSGGRNEGASIIR